jgi:hypothetical protein
MPQRVSIDVRRVTAAECSQERCKAVPEQPISHLKRPPRSVPATAERHAAAALPREPRDEWGKQIRCIGDWRVEYRDIVGTPFGKVGLGDVIEVRVGSCEIAQVLLKVCPLSTYLMGMSQREDGLLRLGIRDDNSKMSWPSRCNIRPRGNCLL